MTFSRHSGSFPPAVLFDRDGTLVIDVPYNGDPSLVEPVAGALEVLQTLRDNGVKIGIVSNQSGIARGIVTREQVDAVNAAIDDQLGPFDAWCVCPHGPEDSCDCRKPEPGLILEACERLGVSPHEVAVIGDIGSDVDAAAAAGARGILVPTPQTLACEVDAAPEVAADLASAIELLRQPATKQALAESRA